MSLMEVFNKAIYESIDGIKGIVKPNNKKYYYPKRYGEVIKDYFARRGIDSKESSKESLRSTASSARLCLNYFYGESVEFEKPIFNDLNMKIAPTKMDAVKNNIYYECKCQEIVNGEHELLRQSYNSKSKLFKEFNIANVKIVDHKNSKGKVDYKYCDFGLRDIGIEAEGKYYDFHINIKQLICHLIAIANQDKDNKHEKVLQYIIFKPKEDLIKSNLELEKLYMTIDKEIDLIMSSNNIKQFIDINCGHNIEIKFVYVYISDVCDVVLNSFIKGSSL